ncbi:hypothetical protein ABMA27_007271 [Loxostege sticticalis]|uniref:Peptidase M14 domain-containing protein n=1 Tax=Loxostege sticticalis TaxID=481309 RepID=A0ABR3HEU4_LOXSC
MNLLQFLFILALSVTVIAEKKSYDGYKLYKVVPKTEKEVEILEEIRDARFADFWNEYFKVNDDVRMLVEPDLQLVVQGRLMHAGVQVSTIIEDVQKVINKQLTPIKDPSRSSSFLSYDWEAYHDLNAIERWLDELVTEYPSIVSPVTMGYSVENRTIRGIVINYNPSRDKPAAIIEGTLHAREWISTAAVTWIIKEFLTSNDEDVRAMAENLEWHIFPVVNPDGYVYTFTDDRMWRKNRSPASFTSCAANNVSDDMSNGVDLNRNFDFEWMTIGASNNSCTNTYAGPSAASEPETKAISNYVLNVKEKADIVYYLSFHSFTQLFILPYSHVTNVTQFPADNHDDLVEIAINSTQKLSERFGTHYRVGIAAEVLYPMGGSSFDWAKAYGNASISYLIELRDEGQYGFLLPPEQIIPNNLEIMDALVEMDKSTKRLGYYVPTSAASTSIYSLALITLAVLSVNLFN